MTRYIVGSVKELRPGSRKIVTLAGRSIGVFNVDGEFFALRNRCPHQGGELCRGKLAGHVTAEYPGEYQYDARRVLLRCPWHGWEFDIRTGQSWFDPSKTRVRNYEVEVASGESIAQVSSPDGLEQGPYVAESYPVSIEEDYVVVQVRT